MHQKGFALLQLATLEYIGPDGEKVFWQGCGLQHGIAFGNGQGLPLGHSHVFCVSAAVGQGAQLVAQLPLRHALAQRHNLP